ncbi:MAG: polyprenyl synthetase family protein [Sulfuriferula sp.]|nr:polyprenyl synthetase family protein [Sulfuriferula sp.]
MTSDFLTWSTALQARTEIVLEQHLPALASAPQTLHQAMRYAVLEGGKRVRPLLAFAAGEACHADPAQVEIVACAVELIHAYSLVHDDMPCMDDDVLRRGKPTCHVEFGEATALLVGDSLQSLAFELLSSNPLGKTPAQQIAMIKLLAQASGSRGMAGGQAIDLASVGVALTLPELEFMHIHKTGALIRAAVLLGAYCGEPLSEQQHAGLDRYAKCAGLAFQVVDDILDAEAPTATLGKTAGKDAEHNKPTYVSLMGITEAKAFARELHRDALDAVDGFDHGQRLRELADFIVQRSF